MSDTMGRGHGTSPSSRRGRPRTPGRLARAVLCGALLVTAAAPALGQGPGRVALRIDGAISSATQSFNGVLDFDLYDETGQFQTQHETEGGAFLDFGGRVTVWQELALGVSYGQVGGTETVTLTGEVPHPFLVGQPRSVGPDVRESTYKERAAHVEIAWRITFANAPRVSLTVFGGPSFFNVTRDAISDIRVQEIGPPFTQVMTTVETVEESKNGTGAHAGVDFTYMASQNVGVGGFVRFSGGSTEITVVGTPTTVDVGGVQAGGGLRLRF